MSGRRLSAVLVVASLLPVTMVAIWVGWWIAFPPSENVFEENRAVLEGVFDPAVWLGCGAPQSVRPGEPFLAAARLVNAGERPWPHRDGPTRFAYRWRRTDGTPGILLAADLDAGAPPGGELRAWVRVRPPDEPGLRTLELVGVFGPVAFAPPAGREPCRAEVDVR